ncbi:MAG: DsbA family protein [Bacteriovoracaceae bacterium]|nr:DsbA family protein [Bacteriovoracaceae bacterium]
MKNNLLALMALLIASLVASCTKVENKKINFNFSESVTSGIAAKVGDFEVTNSALISGIAPMIKKAEQKLFFVKLNRVRAFTIEHFMTNDSRKKKLTNEQFLEKYIVKGATVTSREIVKFAKERHITDDALAKGGMRNKVKQFLLVQKKRERIDAWMAKRSKKHNVVVGLENVLADNKELATATNGLIFGKLPKGVVLKVGSKSFNYAELFSSIKNELFEAESSIHTIKINALKSILVDHFATKLAGKDIKASDYLEKNVYAKIVVSKEEVDEFAKNRSIPATALNEQLLERIKEFVKSAKKKGLLENWLASQTEKSSVNVYFMPPKRPVFEINTNGSVFAGGENAKVVIVEFTDFQCPFCSKGSEVMKGLKKKYGDKIKVVFKHFPLPFHEQAKFAHEVAYCASLQGNKNFWSLYYKFFADQSKLSREQVLEAAKSLKLDMKKVDSCLGSGDAKKVVDRDFKEGQSVGVNSTPTFFVNGQLVMGAQPISVFSELIDKELKK